MSRNGTSGVGVQQEQRRDGDAVVSGEALAAGSSRNVLTMQTHRDGGSAFASTSNQI